jgi:hypothetical protein
MQDWTDFTAPYEHAYRQAQRRAALANAAHVREFARPSLLRRVLASLPSFVHGLRPERTQRPSAGTDDSTIPGWQ